jgi:ATP-dependent Lhr-like helicase
VRRLEAARRLAANTGLTDCSLVCLGVFTWCRFPWRGTRSFRTLRKYLSRRAAEYRISGIEYEGCCYIVFKMEGADAGGLLSGLSDEVKKNGIDVSTLVGQNENPVFEKYDPYIPSELLRRAYYTDKLRAGEVVERIIEMNEEENRF